MKDIIRKPPGNVVRRRRKGRRRKPSPAASERGGNRQVIAHSSHGIQASHISAAARTVVETLQDAGHTAELVGGCVRDLLLGIRPKDFDVATSATPEQVRKLFRRSRIIGRRFLLVHVRVGRELIEVATYRRPPEGSRRLSRGRHLSAQGRILQDNLYGTIEQDAMRRDLSINSLYLSLPEMSVLDFAGGYADARNRIARIIGDPMLRFREDPVRMIRTIRIAASLNLVIDPATMQAIAPSAHLLSFIPHSRLADEISKLIFCGNAKQAVTLMNRFGLTQRVFPAYEKLLAASSRDQTAKWLNAVFAGTDERLRSGLHTSRVYTLATVLWPAFRALDDKNRARDRGSWRNVAADMLETQSERMYLSAKQKMRIIHIWAMQKQMRSAPSGNVEALREERDFRSALRLMELRASFGEVDEQICAKWIALRPESPPRKRKQRRRGRRWERRKRRA